MVEWKKLGDIASVNNGDRPISDILERGSFPYINAGRTNSGYLNECNSKSGAVTTPSHGEGGIGSVMFQSKDFWCGALCYKMYTSDRVINRYLYHYLCNNPKKIINCKNVGGQPYINRKQLENILIAIPSLSEQTQIVGILDTFTSAIDNLKDQIAQRRKQYEYYRDQLLDLEGKPGVEMRTLGESCLIRTGSKPSKILDKGRYCYINAGTTESGYVDESNCDCDVVTTPSRGQGGIGFVGYQRNAFWLGPLCYQIRSNKKENLKSKFLYYYLSSHTEEILKYKSEGGTPAVNAVDLKKIIIPLPPLQAQQRIVSILDTFEASIQNLEAQLKEREKQYEYYRNKLLTFE